MNSARGVGTMLCADMYPEPLSLTVHLLACVARNTKRALGRAGCCIGAGGTPNHTPVLRGPGQVHSSPPTSGGSAGESLKVRRQINAGEQNQCSPAGQIV